jgi:hypothetical protein
MANITIDDLPPVVLPLGNDIVFETIQDGISRKITLPQLVSLMGAIAGVTANDTNPDFLNSKLVAGTNLTFTVNNPGANETLTIDAASSGQVNTIVAGTNIAVDNTDPVNPIVSATSGGQVNTVVGGTNATVDATDPVNPIINVPSLGVEALVAGTNITIDATDPANPIVSASGGGSTFSGCSVALSGNFSTATGVNEILPWDTETYDEGSWHDNVTNNTRLTVPSGVSYVVITVQIAWQFNNTGLRTLSMVLNGTTPVQGRGETVLDATNSGSQFQTIVTGPIAVTPGDYFEFRALQNSGGAVNVLSDSRTWAAIQAVG